MEPKTQSRKLVIAVLVATVCLLLWLLSLAGGSAQTAVGAGAPFPSTPGFEAAQRISVTSCPGATASHEHEDKSLDRKGELVGDAVLLVATPVPWPDPDGYESDDAQYEANRITVNDHSPQRHNFHAAGDEDWVKFWAWAGNTYTITTSDLDFGCDTVLELYDAESHKLKEDDDGGEEPRASKIDDWTPSENGTYYVRVSQYDPIGENLWYSLEITDSVTCKDEYEPDDTCHDANEIAVGMSQAHNFHGPCGGDEDWVWFEAVGGNVYTIWTFNLEGSNDTRLCLYDEDGNPLHVCNDDDPDNIPGSRIVWEAPANGGEYCVKVSPFEPSAGKSCAGECDVSYFLSVATLINTTPTPTPTPTGDSHEPDDAKHEAKRIPVNGTSQDHTFHVEDDEDWVKFWAWAGNDYIIRTFKLGGGNDTTLKLYDAESHKLKEDDDGGGEPGASRIDWRAPENGTYFVRVARPKVGGSGYHGLSSSDDLTYSLEVRETIPCRDEYELNSDDDCEEAEWITVGGSSQVHNFHVPCFNSYHSPDTADWVKFEATKGFTYTIKTSHLEGGNDTVLGLYDANCITVTVNGDEVVNDDYPDDIPASRIVWEAPKDGTYYVKVSPFDHRAGGCDVSYTLEVIPWVASVDLMAHPDEVSADGVETSTLTATVKDYSGDPVSWNQTVCFTTTLGNFLGELCKSTGDDGRASVELTSPVPGTATVMASAGPITATVTVTFTQPYLTLAASPDVVPADGVAISTLTATVQYTSGTRVLSETVCFTTTLGEFVDGKECDDLTGENGEARVVLTSTETGTAIVTATFDPINVATLGSITDTVQVTFTPPIKLVYLSLVLKPPPTPTPCPCVDVHEPDDYAHYKDWPPLEPGEPFNSYICEEHIHLEDSEEVERDWYWFGISRLSTITIDLTVPDTVNYDLFLWVGDKWLPSINRDRGADEHIVYSPTGTGEYIVVVKSLGDYDNCNPYTLTATY